MADSTTRPDGQPERRRSNRAALNLSATMREGSRSKAQVRVIDISTHGCRIECTTQVTEDSKISITRFSFSSMTPLINKLDVTMIAIRSSDGHPSRPPIAAASDALSVTTRTWLT